MTTIIIGDIHLMSTLILPLIDEAIKDKQIDQIIFTGDYCDQWSQQYNSALYQNDLAFLLRWKQKKEALGIQVMNLLGNHDLPYIVDRPAHYSLLDEQVRQDVRELLLALKPQISCWVGEYLVSHGGYLSDVEIDPYEQTPLTVELLENAEVFHHIRVLLQEVGQCRGGHALYGGPVWADIMAEFPRYPSKYYSKQVVGHRPIPEIEVFTNKKSQMIGIDTFTITRKQEYPFFRPIAEEPAVLMIVEGETDVLPIPGWTEEEMGEAIYQHYAQDSVLEFD